MTAYSYALFYVWPWFIKKPCYVGQGWIVSCMNYLAGAVGAGLGAKGAD